jgi:SAM-dependent methyltransferase
MRIAKFHPGCPHSALWELTRRCRIACFQNTYERYGTGRRHAIAPLVQSAKVTRMETLPCNLCGSEEYSVLFESGVAQVNGIVKCKSCGLLYAHPRQRKPDVDLIRNYDANWVYEHRDTTNKWRSDKESLQVRDYRSTKRILAEKFPHRGILVEIGCGLGYLLNFFKTDGWSTIGIEPNAGLCLCAQRDLGLTTIEGTLDDARFEAGHATVATMMHVIEHVPDPMSTFREVYRILKPGGYFVVETPRYDTLMFKILGRRERSLSCDGHIYFFTTKTLARMATTAGFTIVRTDYVGRSLTLDRLMYNFGVMSKSSTIERVLKKMSSALRLNHVAITLNVRDMQRMYLEKPT